MNAPFGLAFALWLALAASPCGATEAWNDRGLDTPRLAPEFITPQGKYAWLNRHTFVATLAYPVPESMRLARNEAENDRLIEVYQVR
jgi:hypothetical protein